MYRRAQAAQTAFERNVLLAPSGCCPLPNGYIMSGKEHMKPDAMQLLVRAIITSTACAGVCHIGTVTTDRGLWVAEASHVFGSISVA